MVKALGRFSWMRMRREAVSKFITDSGFDFKILVDNYT